jgi:hypothetical protein
LLAQEKIVGEGEYKGFIANEGEQTFKVSRIKPGQTLQISFTPQWSAENGARAEWRLEDQDGFKLKAGKQAQPEAATLLIEWTSNSEPKPAMYLFHIRGTGGRSPGEILGQYTLQIHLWDQNDGNLGTDAPESFEKALLLPVSDPGTYSFDECFISSTSDIYDIYKILLKPGHSLSFRAKPLQWKGGPKGAIRWEFLNRSFKSLKTGQSIFPETQPFIIKVFHPQVKPDTKPALFYILVKVEGDVSAVYSLQAEVKEGR